MIDAETIEVITHLMKTPFPPGIIIFLHCFPVIGREHPVLTVNGEIIGRRTGLTVHIKILRFRPGVDTGTVHTDRKVAFQDYSVLTGIVGYRFELRMQNELQEIIKDISG